MLALFIALTEQILAFYPAVIGVYIAYKLLKITDLSADGSYVLGASVYAHFLGPLGPWGAMLLVFMSGALTGGILSFMQKGHRVHPLIAGILMSFMLYSINFEILGRPNLSLFGQATVLRASPFSQWISVLFLINVFYVAYTCLLSQSAIGLGIKAFGANPYLMDRFGLRPELYRFIGLAGAGSLYATAGALFAQVYGFVDLSMGSGVSLIALAAVILGDKMSSHFSLRIAGILKDLIAIFLASCFYFLILQFFMSLGFEPVHLKLFVGLILYAVMYGQNKMYSLRGA